MRGGHIVICGTGRAGTTLLVRILRNSGLDTGFSEDDISELREHYSNAGLETKALKKARVARLPDVIKNPKFFEYAGEGLSEGWLHVDRMIIPIRDIDEVLASRKRVTQRTFWEYFTRKGLRGGFVGGPQNIFNQRAVMLNHFFRNVHLAVEYQIPITFLSFPRFVSDEEYFIRTLGPPLRADRGIEDDALRRAHQAEADPSLVRTGTKPKGSGRRT